MSGIGLIYGTSASGGVLFSDNFESYPTGTSLIYFNSWPNYYRVDSAGYCGNSAWQSTHPAPPNDSYARHEPCIGLNNVASNWFQGAAWYVSATQAHSGSKSLYLQQGNAPDAVTAGIAVKSANVPTSGVYVVLDEWVYPGPWSSSDNRVRLVIDGSWMGIAYQEGSGANLGYWSYSTGFWTPSYHDLGYFLLNSYMWHHIVVTTQITGPSTAVYYSLQIDGQTPFDSILRGQLFSDSRSECSGATSLGPACKWENVIGAEYGVCYTVTYTQPPPCYGLWNGHSIAWMYIDDWSMYLTTSPSSTTTMIVSYSVVGGGSPTAPVFNYVLKGVSKSLTLSETPKVVSVDAGSTWSVTPNPLAGSGSSHRWYSSQSLTGTASAATIVFTFQRQYYLTMLVNGPGSVTPTSGWFDAGAKVTIKATANSRHKFKSWTGKSTGSFTGTTNPATITMNSAITETATFS